MSKKNSEKIWNTAMYVRISREDSESTEKIESNSIANQKELISNFCRVRNDLNLISIHIDDGFRGGSFERPAFFELQKEIEEGKINCVVVKDLSRLGRNHIETTKLLEYEYPKKDVRFIAINDNFDSKEKNAMTSLYLALKNLINESYSFELSKKIKTVLDEKRKKGDYIGSFTVLGYKKDEHNKNKIVIDEYASEIIKDIFNRKIDGMSNKGIADYLNRTDILSPLDYRKQKEGNFSEKEKTLWCANTVGRILKNDMYIGRLIQGKTKTKSHKDKKQIIQDKKDWHIVENSHEPIISSEKFELVQKLLKMDTQVQKNSDYIDMFSGLLYCADCHETMVTKKYNNGYKDYFYYVCRANRKGLGCTSHKINRFDLENIVLKAIKNYVSNVVDIENVTSKAKKLQKQNRQYKLILKAIQFKKQDYEKLNKIFMSVTENYEEKLLNKSEYIKLNKEYSNRIDIVLDEISTLQKELKELKGAKNNSKQLQELEQYKNIKKLNRRTLVYLIDNIIVYEDGNIEINFRHNQKSKPINEAEKNYEEKRDSYDDILNLIDSED